MIDSSTNNMMNVCMTTDKELFIFNNRILHLSAHKCETQNNNINRNKSLHLVIDSIQRRYNYIQQMQNNMNSNSSLHAAPSSDSCVDFKSTLMHYSTKSLLVIDVIFYLICNHLGKSSTIKHVNCLDCSLSSQHNPETISIKFPVGFCKHICISDSAAGSMLEIDSYLFPLRSSNVEYLHEDECEGICEVTGIKRRRSNTGEKSNNSNADIHKTGSVTIKTSSISPYASNLVLKGEVVQVSASDSHYLFLCKEGSRNDGHSGYGRKSNVYAYGRNLYGELGMSSHSINSTGCNKNAESGYCSLEAQSAWAKDKQQRYNCFSRPVLVNIEFAVEEVDQEQARAENRKECITNRNEIVCISVSAGVHYSACITRERVVYTWGDNTYSRCGHEFEFRSHTNDAIFPSPTVVSSLNVFYDLHPSACATGGVPAQHMNRDDRDAMPGMGLGSISRIACSLWHTVVQTDMNDVYFFGWNKDGQGGGGKYLIQQWFCNRDSDERDHSTRRGFPCVVYVRNNNCLANSNTIIGSVDSALTVCVSNTNQATDECVSYGQIVTAPARITEIDNILLTHSEYIAGGQEGWIRPDSAPNEIKCDEGIMKIESGRDFTALLTTYGRVILL